MRKTVFVLCGLVLTFAVGLAQVDSAPAKPKRGFLGVVSGELNRATLVALGVEQGVIVNEVIDSSPASEAGFKVGDVILKLDGETVSDPSELRRLVRDRADKSVPVAVMRTGARKTINVTVGRRKGFDLSPLKATFLTLGVDMDELEPIQRVLEDIGPEVRREILIRDHTLDSLREELRELREELRQLKEQVQSQRQNN